MTEVTVLCAVRGPDETAVVTVLGAAGTPGTPGSPGTAVTVTRRCAELAELLAAAEAGAGVVAVVSADLPGLDREVVARLRRAGTRVVLVAEGHVPAARLAGLGPDAVIPGGPVDPEGLLAAVRAETAPGRPPEAEQPAPDVGWSDVNRPDHNRPDHNRPGSVVAVWGPVGAPGRTTTAIELAAALAGLPDRAGNRTGSRTGAGGDPAAAGMRRQARPAAGPRTGRRHRAGPRDTVLLVDADTYGSSVATRLGLLDDAPGLAAAARAAGQGVLDLVTLAGHSPVALPGVRVLTGITRPARWPELPASALEVVWERARELARWTVVDCGPLLEADELLMYDTQAPQRNAATLAALTAADVVVVVGAADPVGLQRLVRGLEDLREVPVPLAGARVVVANRVRSGAAGPRPEAAVRDALARYAGVRDLHVVPDDPAGADAALLAGRALAEQAPGSPARTAFASLAERVRGLVPAAG